MGRKGRRESDMCIYHIVTRGINKQIIFEEDADYRKYLRVLEEAKKKFQFDLLAYCLMPNHIHLLMRSEEQLDLVFKSIGSRFVIWYNTKYNRVGHLFQDRFYSEPIYNERHFLAAVRYIHLNPVKAGICVNPEQYIFSSYNTFYEKSELLDVKMFRSIVAEEDFESFHRIMDEYNFYEPDELKKRRYTDEVAKALLIRKTGCKNASDFQALPKELRNQFLRAIRREGVSIRQASRLTGISEGVIRYII